MKPTLMVRKGQEGIRPVWRGCFLLLRFGPVFGPLPARVDMRLNRMFLLRLVQTAREALCAFLHFAHGHFLFHRVARIFFFFLITSTASTSLALRGSLGCRASDQSSHVLVDNVT